MRLLATVLTVLTVAAPAGTAWAANGVHVDPGSPSQHQYAFPVNAARNETAGGAHSSKLFGNGITPSSSKGSISNTTNKGTSSKANKNAGTGSDLSQNPAYYALASSSHGASAPGAATDPSNGGSGWLPLAGGGALVLLLGCGGGLALRRRLRA